MIAEDISSNDLQNNSKANLKSNINAPPNQSTFQAIDQLELLINRAQQAQDRKEIKRILHQILDYPSTDWAYLHRQCMQIGEEDLVLKDQQKKDPSQKNLLICQCCGFKKQQNTIPMCTSFNDIKNIGTATELYFSSFKSLSILLGVLAVIYAIYSFATNLVSNKNNSGNVSVDYLSISLAPKQKVDTPNNRLYYFVQTILGAVTMLIWVILFIGIKYYDIKKEEEEDNQTVSASDYTVALEGVPVDINQKQLQEQFNSYYAAVTEHQKIPTKRRKQFKIVKLNVAKPYYLSEQALKNDQLKQIDKQLTDLKETFISWIKQRQNHSQFSETKQSRHQKYDLYKKLLTDRYTKLQEIEQLIKKQLEDQTTGQLTTAFVTFETNYAQQLMSYLNDLNIFRRIQGICGDVNRFVFFRGERGYHLAIRRAPEPEDINWTNIGLRDCSVYGRKIFTYIVTAVLLGVCFAIVYALSSKQRDLQSNPDTSGSSRILSIIISIVISLVNIILGQVIKFLSIFERDYTETNHQASLALKSIIAQMVNCILIPVIVAFYINNNIYETSGLADNVFMLCITNSLVPPALVFFDAYNIFVRIVAFFKSRPTSKLYQTQKQHNLLHQKIQFEVGFHYIYVVNLFMFVCFFVSLQPIAPVCALVGYLLMYWAQKYCLLNRYKRPIPGTDFVHKAVYQIIYLGPLVYTLGSLTWSNLSPSGIPPQALFPNLVSLGFSILILIVPFPTIIVGCLKEDAEARLTHYQDQRIIFPSEYDRSNPNTSKEAIKQFQQFRKKNVQKIKNLPKEQQQKVLKLIADNAQRAALNQTRPQNQLGLAGLLNPTPAPYIPPPMFHSIANIAAPSAFGGHFGSAYTQPGMVPQVAYGSPYTNMGYNAVPMVGLSPYNNYGMYGGYRPY